MPPGGRDLGERTQDEGPPVQARVRHDQAAGQAEDAFTEGEQVEIEDAGGVDSGSRPPEPRLDRVKCRQQPRR